METLVVTALSPSRPTKVGSAAGSSPSTSHMKSPAATMKKSQSPVCTRAKLYVARTTLARGLEPFRESVGGWGWDGWSRKTSDPLRHHKKKAPRIAMAPKATYSLSGVVT